jgi:ABC-2 type transport system ATP-binding protein
MECLRLFADARGLGRIPDESFALAESLNLTPMLDLGVASYSLGARQKLGVILGLLGQPPLLILDEPLNGLDPLSAYRFKSHLSSLARERGATVLLTTHALDVAERVASRVVLLMNGLVARIWAACDLEKLRADPARSLETEMINATSPDSIR